ncbi:MAG: ATP-dependent Clp protease adaptor ClpS [Desulfobacteraceae bacterium]|nr:ATP-dependent Clp protease adaptor ClpS [Desulfobacteraceae bacterium]
MGTKKTGTDQEILEGVVDKTTGPPLYKVLIFNDDFTTKMFVVQVLMNFFNKSEDAATQLMWHIHRNGMGVCGIYPLDVAETKIKTVTDYARKHDYPLRVSMEAE